MVKFLFLFLLPLQSMGWGFFAHQEINRLAVFTLPPEIIGFYKSNIHLISKWAVNPDKRRYVLKEEACRHYIDFEFYKGFCDTIPKYWTDAQKLYPTDSLLRHGIVPWYINVLRYQLTNAFKEKDGKKIIKLSADLGHYIADANVPLHTTCNYNGQLTNQSGIHGLWESRLPELFFNNYSFWVGPAEYIPDIQDYCWVTVYNSNTAVDSVLSLEKLATEKIQESMKYSYEDKGSSVVRVYSLEFCSLYHQMLNGMVERQMRRAIKMTGDIWYTCWVNAGKPDLSKMKLEEDEKEEPLPAELHNECKH
ncbi:MAG: zinc dependent phospholipase C family protein [Cytophagaceae bacterium]